MTTRRSPSPWRARATPGAPLVALAIDCIAGEPPTAMHPTAAMGSAIAAARRRHPSGATPTAGFLGGLKVVATGVLAAGIVAVVVQRAADEIARALPEAFPASALLDGALLKPSLSLRALLAAGAEVENALRIGDLGQARRSLAWHLVSRDASSLSASEVAGAAIASLAENVSDALVAPLLAYGLGGLPAAYAYRFVNTADAMLGYRTPELEWFGKSAARLDDLLNLVPARLAALLIGTAAPVGGGSTRCALRCALRDHGRTPSPNAGWPMAAMAGALGVRLNKRGVYVLNPWGRAPGWRDITRARRVILATAIGAVALSEAGIALGGW